VVFCKFFEPYHSNMAWRQRECGGMALPIHDLGTWWGGWSLPGPDPLNPPPHKRPGAHCTGGWVGPKTGLGGCGKSCCSGLELWTTHLEPCGCFCQSQFVNNETVLYCTVGTELSCCCCQFSVLLVTYVNCLVLQDTEVWWCSLRAVSVQTAPA